MVEHMTENDLYAECKHVFRKHRSCVPQLLEVMVDFAQLTDNGCPLVVYLD